MMRDMTPQASRPLSKQKEILHYRQASMAGPTANKNTLLNHSYGATQQRAVEVPASRRAMASSQLSKPIQKIETSGDYI